MSTDAPDTAAPFEKGYYDPPGTGGGARKVTSDITPAEATAFKELESQEKLAVIAHAEQRTASIDSSTMARNLARVGSVLVGFIGASGILAHLIGQVTEPSAHGSFPWGAVLVGLGALVVVLLCIIAISADARRTARARARVDLYRAIAALPGDERPTTGQDSDSGNADEEPKDRS